MSAVPKRKSLDLARNEAVRAYLRRVVAEDFEGVVSRAAVALDVSQPMLSDLLAGKRGAGLSLIDAIAHLRHVSVDVVLGRAAGPDTPYPNKLPVIASAEFAAAPESVRATFLDLERDGGDQSVVGWSWDLLRLMQAESMGLLKSRGGARLEAEPAEHQKQNVIPLFPPKS